jgi:nicotinamidase-related amidase
MADSDDILRPDRCALLVVDVQVDNCGTGGRLAELGRDISWARNIVPGIVAMIAGARAVGVPVVFTRQVQSFDGLIEEPSRARLLRRSPHVQGDNLYQLEGTRGTDVLPELDPRPNERQLIKYRSSAFHGTPLDLLLRGWRVETVVVVGVVTEGCVESTVRDTASYGYLPVVVSDAVASSNLGLHSAAMAVMQARYEVTTTAELVDNWNGQLKPLSARR